MCPNKKLEPVFQHLNMSHCILMYADGEYTTNLTVRIVSFRLSKEVPERSLTS
jgi:hypothetical protein